MKTLKTLKAFKALKLKNQGNRMRPLDLTLDLLATTY